MNLSKNVKLSVIAAAAAAGTTAIDSAVLDMQGYTGVMFIALLGDVTDTSVLTLTAKGNSANSTSSPTPVTQLATLPYTANATTADSKAIVLDVFDPVLRYVFVTLTRATANAAVGGIVALQYGPDQRPTVHDATVIASNFGPGVAA